MDSFAMFLHADEAAEPFEPTAADFETDDDSCTCTAYSMGVETTGAADFTSCDGCPIHDPNFEDDDLDECAECGAECYANQFTGLCGACHDSGDRDFPMYLEYEGAFGLAGYDDY